MEGLSEKSRTVFFLSSEATPFAKTGGLADVAGSLPDALRRQGVDVRVGLPFYRVTRKGGFSTRPLYSDLEVPLGSELLKGHVIETHTKEGVPVYLFEREDLFDRPNLYATSEGDYYDNLERFAYFSRAALIFAKLIGIPFDVIHCHDWQTGLVPAYLKTIYLDDPFFAKTASLFTIHNLGYQGLFSKEKLAVCSLPPDVFHLEGVEYWGRISLLKAGVIYADALTTVSPAYAKEIQTPEFGFGMEGILKKRSANLYGILNGTDYSVWSPEKDPELPYPYDLSNLREKARNKKALLNELRLAEALENKPLFGMISRLSAQKGCDLLVKVMDELVHLGAGVVILGAGEQEYQSLLEKAAGNRPDRVAIRIGFNESLAHRIIAGADMLLMPSRYEPCGLTQMYALRYGTVPVVRATGGLDDTIVQFDPESKQGNGFKFSPHSPEALMEALKKALRIYREPATWEVLITNGMKEDFSWERSAQRYVDLYKTISLTPKSNFLQ
ncbi:MAG: glycogen synthase GlgA [Deltaproteobacteria bacterium]|nr:glycogen synthase GlgA [Deltaproteobacteria bacterium]